MVKKQIHVYLNGEDQIQDYELVKQDSGITNDSDLVRYLFRQHAQIVQRETEWHCILSAVRAYREGRLSQQDLNAALGIINTPVSPGPEA